MSLDGALYKLLHVRSYRRALLDKQYDKLGLPADALVHLHTIDTAELEALSEKICRDLLRGNIELEGGLRGSYPRTLAELERSGRSALDVMYDFVESDPYASFRQVPYGEPGVCAEEAFFEFLSADEGFLRRSPDNEAILVHEFLSAILGILAVNRDPNFIVRTTRPRHNGVAHYAIERYSPELSALLTGKPQPDPGGEILFLYASNQGRFVRGPISKIAAVIIETGSLQAALEEPEELAARAAVDVRHVEANARKLHTIGLIA